MKPQKYNPREPRYNSEFNELLPLIKGSCQELVNETDFTRRRGRAYILMAHLEQLVEEPEFFLDLEEGLINNSKYWLKTEDFNDKSPTFLPEKPFDKFGYTENLFFVYTDHGKLSNLYPAPPIDNYFCGPFNQGYFVYTLEKKYATETVTKMHINNVELFSKCLKDMQFIDETDTQQGEKNHFILCDPQGVNYGIPIMVTSINNLEKAINIADTLAEYLDIRFLVATEIYKFNAH